MRRLRVLMSAYACEPDRGSEPGVGWDLARSMAELHDVWVITRANNRPLIQRTLGDASGGVPRFSYVDLPRWASWWKRGPRGAQAYYYLWQYAALRTARSLHARIGFDLVHHVTFAKYWAPSHLWRLGLPFVWGPVGGGDTTPRELLAGLGFRGRLHEGARGAARFLGERDPWVVATARHANVGLATTPATAERLVALGAKDVRVLPAIALSGQDRAALATMEVSPSPGVRFLALGNLLGLKGTHLGLRAFARAELPDASFWIVGDGPERSRLQRLARELGLGDHVVFWGSLPRQEAFGRLAEADVLVHPSLHDSGGMVCLEAMAAGKPVVCLDLGGPGALVTEETGIKVPHGTTESTIERLAAAMRRLQDDASLRTCLGAAGRRAVADSFTWETKRAVLDEIYGSLA